MLEGLALYAAYALALGLVVMVPGPSVIATIGKALATSPRRTLPFVLGILTGDIVFLTVAVLGLAFFATKFSAIFILIKLAGALYLCWMAWTLWFTKIEIQTQEREAQNDQSVFGAGLLLGISNPKAVAFYTALLPSFVDLTEIGFVGWAVLAAINAFIVFIILMTYANAAGRAKAIGGTQLIPFHKVSACLLGGAGGLMLVQLAKEG